MDGKRIGGSINTAAVSATVGRTAMTKRQRPTCDLCGSPNARRRLPYNKADSRTGLLSVCSRCADALPVEKDTDGKWSLTVDLEEGVTG
jgi:hypothetical protein